MELSRLLKVTPRHWLKFVLSIPRNQPMTGTEAFTHWSSLLAYVLGGCTFLLAPQLWQLILQIELEGRSEGYLRLFGLALINVGDILAIAARSNHKFSRHQECLTSVLARLILVNCVVLAFISTNMLPFSFALTFMVLDSLLALIILLIWFLESKDASLGSFFREIFQPFWQFPAKENDGFTITEFLLGIPQFLIWLMMAVKPGYARQMFHLDAFQGHSDGYLAACFLLLSIQGLHHMVGASNGNHCLNVYFVFGRIILNIPGFLILFLVGQIERNLCLLLCITDLSIFVVMLTYLLRELWRGTHSGRVD